MATKRIEAIEAVAVTEIELSCLRAKSRSRLQGLDSAPARSFVENLPSIDSLMPALSYVEIAGEADPPIAEQLLTSNALRQQRFWNKQKVSR